MEIMHQRLITKIVFEAVGILFFYHRVHVDMKKRGPKAILETPHHLNVEENAVKRTEKDMLKRQV